MTRRGQIEALKLLAQSLSALRRRGRVRSTSAEGVGTDRSQRPSNPLLNWCPVLDQPSGSQAGQALRIFVAGGVIGCYMSSGPRRNARRREPGNSSGAMTRRGAPRCRWWRLIPETTALTSSPAGTTSAAVVPVPPGPCSLRPGADDPNHFGAEQLHPDALRPVQIGRIIEPGPALRQPGQG
jgi:hypothetical protein